MAVLPEEPSGWEADLDDRVVLLLVGDDPGALIEKKRIVGKVEAARRRRHCCRGVLPLKGTGRVHHQEPVLAPVGAEETALVGGPGSWTAHRTSVPAGAKRDDRLQRPRRDPCLIFPGLVGHFATYEIADRQYPGSDGRIPGKCHRLRE